MLCRFRFSSIAAAALIISACTTQPGPKETGGALVGAAAGGLAGSQFGRGGGSGALIGVGVLLGTLMGNEVGRSLGRADQLTMERSTQNALEQARTGTVSEWRNPDTGHYGTVTPTRTFTDAQGIYCREFQQTVTIGGQTQQPYGTACRQPDCSWTVLS